MLMAVLVAPFWVWGAYIIIACFVWPDATGWYALPFSTVLLLIGGGVTWLAMRWWPRPAR